MIMCVIAFCICRYFNEFLLAHSRETAEQIQGEYIDTLSKIYFSYFKDYYNKLMKLQVCVRERGRVLLERFLISSLKKLLRKMT